MPSVLDKEEDNDFTKILKSSGPANNTNSNNRKASSSAQSRSTWFGNGTETCPSCKGSGVKEAAEELIALVPYSDERLQPRRTFLKLFTALTIAGVVIGVLLFVFLPRHAEAKTTLLTMESGVISPAFSWLNITDQATITNQNYFSITVMSMNISLKCIDYGQHGDTVDVGTRMITGTPISARTSVTIPYEIETKYEDTPGNSIYRLCCSHRARNNPTLWYKVDMNSKFKYLYNYFSYSHSTFWPIECNTTLYDKVICNNTAKEKGVRLFSDLVTTSLPDYNIP